MSEEGSPSRLSRRDVALSGAAAAAAVLAGACRGSRPGQLIGRGPWMQSVHATASDRLLGRIVPVRILQGHANSLSGAVAVQVADLDGEAPPGDHAPGAACATHRRFWGIDTHPSLCSRTREQPLVRRLGRDGAAEIWRFAANSCFLDVFLYRESDGLRVAHLEARSRTTSRGRPFA